MVAQGYNIDLSKPLVFQVGHLGDAYDEWVHKPIVGSEIPRFFANGFIEFLTRTTWWAIPVIWLPVVGWAVWQSAIMGLSPLGLMASVAVGLIVWTLLEYCLHRFLFHMTPSGYWGRTIHYLIHGCHHKHPKDRMRLVFPPAATAILLFPLWNLVKCIAPTTMAPAVLGGGLLGYVIYDCTHYYLHHGRPSKGFSHYIKMYHVNHHFKIQDKGFGVTSPFWDKIFGTLPPEPQKKSS